jgi:DNA-binding transcriptional regulator YiaG
MDRGMTAKQLAEKLEVCTETVLHWERNEKRPTSRQMKEFLDIPKLM